MLYGSISEMKPLNHRVKIYTLLLLVAVNAFVWYAVQAEDRGGKLTVAYLDIGQGDAVLIRVL
jgi:beta-lactamase superfamily II metal-dependent hydrolase